jgi:hypothetical protein
MPNAGKKTCQEDRHIFSEPKRGLLTWELGTENCIPVREKE